MNRITSSIAHIKKTGETKFHESIKVSKEEIARHVHPRHKRKDSKDNKIDEGISHE